MNKKLLLTSQGVPRESKGLSAAFLSMLTKTPQETDVSFITTAAYIESENPTWLGVYRQQLNDYGIGNVKDLDLREIKGRELYRELSDKDIIFMNGGNPFGLLDFARKSGFDVILPELLDEGKRYIGISAGSNITGPTIENATWKHPERNKIGLIDLSALNLVPFEITPHFEEKYRALIEEKVKGTKCPVVGLYDTQAVLVDNDRFRIVGEGKKEFFNGFEERF